MNRVIVETSNVASFLQGFRALERRGAEEACLMVVDGQPGLGKTTALTHWVAQTGAIYLRACKEWSPNWFLADLLQEGLRISPKHGYQQRFRQSLEGLLLRQSDHARQKRTFAVVIDEADHISRNARIMESIRDFSDIAAIPFVLVGMGKIRDNLSAFPQVASRISQYVRFERASLDDVEQFATKLCEVPVADDLVQFVHTVSNGYNREVKEALASIERFGKRNGAEAGRPVSLADLAGQVLINDRRTGNPIIVPEHA